MSSEITQSTYYREIEDLARQCRTEARERGRDLSEVIQEVVDGHSWIIYNRHTLAVLQYTDHEDAAEDALEEVRRGVRLADFFARGVSGLLTYLACAAMIRDVEEAAADLEDEEEDEEDEEDA